MIDISDILDRINCLDEAKGEFRLDTKAAWIALVAHYLELRTVHEKSQMKWAKKKPKGIIKDPVTISDPETGEVYRRPVKGKRKKETAVTELDPGDFARWRGIDPVLFSRMLERYQKRAERFRKTKEHKNIMRRAMRADPLTRSQRMRTTGRRRHPDVTFRQIKVLAKFLRAKKLKPSLNQKDWAERNGMTQTNLSQLLTKHGQEAESYNALTKAGQEIPEPEKVTWVAKEDRAAYHGSLGMGLKKLLPELAQEISTGRREGRITADDTIALVAKKHGVGADSLKKVWLKLKDTHEVRSAIAKKMGLPEPVKKRRGPKPKPKKPKVQRPLLRTRGSYRKGRTGEVASDAWMELAIAVEKEGQITDAMSIHFADLVDIRVIKAVKSFPEKWGDKQIAGWMVSKRESYVKEAKPKLEAKLKEMDLWNPRRTTVKKMPIPKMGEPAALIQADPWIGLKGWYESRRPNVLIIGGLPARNLKAHLAWMGRYFNLTTLGTQQTGKKGTGSVNFIRNAVRANDPDLIILLSGFMRHGEIDAAKGAAKPGVPVVSNVQGKALKALGAAAAGAHQQHVAPWFVDSYEREKGRIQDSIDSIIYNLIEGATAESILNA